MGEVDVNSERYARKASAVALGARGGDEETLENHVSYEFDDDDDDSEYKPTLPNYSDAASKYGYEELQSPPTANEGCAGYEFALLTHRDTMDCDLPEELQHNIPYVIFT